MAIKMRSRYSSSCKTCSGVVNIGQEVFWTPGSKGVSHVACPDTSIDTSRIAAKRLIKLERPGSHPQFPGLFRHQQEVVNTFEKTPDGKLYLAFDAGLGKAQPLTAKVLTPQGFIQMGDVGPGTTVSTPDGGIAKVLKVFPQGEEEVFRVTLNDGSSTLASGEHLWTVTKSGNFSRKKDGRAKYSHVTETLTTKELMSRKLAGADGRLRYRVPSVTTEFHERDHLLDPYLLGALIGDGGFSTSGVYFTSADQDIHDTVKSMLPSGVRRTDTGDPITKRFPKVAGNYRNALITELTRLGLMGHTSHGKFIPDEYKVDSWENRVSLVQGLMDTDGYISKYCTMEFVSVSERLAHDFLDVVRSLGAYAKISRKQTSWTHKGVRNVGEAWRVQFNVPKRNPFNPFRVTRKASSWRNTAQRERRIMSIVPAGAEKTQCILIDHPDHLYITDDYIPTHNTLTALAAAQVSDSFPLIVVCPSVVKINWQRETQRWIGKEAQILSGRTPKDIEKDVVIINYEILEHWADHLIDLNPKGIVLDEIHYAKNKAAKRTKAVIKVAQEVPGLRLGLSGTSTPNSVYDLMAPLEALGMLDAFGGQRKYISRYCPPVQTQWGVSYKRSRNLSELHENLKNVGYVRRKREDCLDLPEKIITELPIEIKVPVNKEFYEPLVAKMERGTLAEAERVLKEANEDYIYAEFLREREAVGLAKVNDIVNLCADIDEPLVIMVHHKAVVSALMEKLKRRKPVKIVGGMTPKARQKSIDDFQNGETDTLICSIDAAGIGINLQRGTQMIIGELPWTSAQLEQAESRCHRAGSVNDLTVYRLLAQNSTDEMLMGVINKKEAVSAEVEDGELMSAKTYGPVLVRKMVQLYKA